MIGAIASRAEGAGEFGCGESEDAVSQAKVVDVPLKNSDPLRDRADAFVESSPKFKVIVPATCCWDEESLAAETLVFAGGDENGSCFEISAKGRAGKWDDEAALVKVFHHTLDLELPLQASGGDVGEGFFDEVVVLMAEDASVDEVFDCERVVGISDTCAGEAKRGTRFVAERSG